jgi:flavorubredoxin
MTTRIDEIASSVFRISTAIPPGPQMPPGFTFNQFLIVDDEPVLFHTGMRKLFPQVREAIARVMPIERLRWISFSHHESDESGALLEWLAAAPQAQPLVGRMTAMYSVEDSCDREAKILDDGETLAIGAKRVQWIDTPHVPHGWDAGLLFEQTTRTLFCSDLFAQPGADHAPTTESDVVGPSEQLRAMFDYCSNPARAAATVERLIGHEPSLLATMHGSAFRGDCNAALRSLASCLKGTA